ncbi:hypothetical protein KPL71_027093 [Citrus sinensis]|uniref:Uncharacterized protein n=1 Tax=Citrus sinensis TaxID=2711 RepID=A0ACB8I3Y8_CITSI|nr:hypothetical protein KPL71_027093 [Citrus sinensis]
MVLLAGGSSPVFYHSDHQMIEEDFDRVIGLMGQQIEKLIEDFTILFCETSGIGVGGTCQKADPSTILRVLCHMNDRTANQFLKKYFQLAKR